MIDLDLYNKQYDLQFLKEHIYAVCLWDILKTQKLTSDFCVKYILNKNYQMEKNDETITINDVITLQPHISKTELLVRISNYSPDDDSFEDFESFSNRHK
jgi:hypothetical protein